MSQIRIKAWGYKPNLDVHSVIYKTMAQDVTSGWGLYTCFGLSSSGPSVLSHGASMYDFISGKDSWAEIPEHRALQGPSQH